MARIAPLHEGGFVPEGTEHLAVRLNAAGHYELWCALNGDAEPTKTVSTVFATRPEALAAATALADSLGVAMVYLPVGSANS